MKGLLRTNVLDRPALNSGDFLLELQIEIAVLSHNRIPAHTVGNEFLKARMSTAPKTLAQLRTRGSTRCLGRRILSYIHLIGSPPALKEFRVLAIPPQMAHFG